MSVRELERSTQNTQMSVSPWIGSRTQNTEKLVDLDGRKVSANTRREVHLGSRMDELSSCSWRFSRPPPVTGAWRSFYSVHVSSPVEA